MPYSRSANTSHKLYEDEEREEDANWKQYMRNQEYSPWKWVAFPKLMDLPFEIRMQIYGWVIGHRTIHVYLDKLFKDPESLRLYRCQCVRSEHDFYNACSTPAVSNNEPSWAWKMGLRPDWRWILHHGLCYYAHSKRLNCHRGYKELVLDMRLLSISPETHQIGEELFYATNLFSLQDPSAAEHFLAKVPSNLVPKIENVHLEMWMQGMLSDADSLAAQWCTCLTDIIAKQLVGLKALHLVIYLGGYVTCWRKSQYFRLTGLFRSLRHLKRLKDFTIVILEDVTHHAFGACKQLVHDDDAHLEQARHDETSEINYWIRKEVMRQWAAEIRMDVLSKEETISEISFETFSLD